MSIYTGTFQSLSGTTYQVDIRTSDEGAGATLTLASEPVTITWEPGQDECGGYRSSTCRIRIVTDSDLSALYAGGPLSNSVNVSIPATRKVVWSGYVIPFQYDAPMTGVNDVIEIDAVDVVTAHKNSHCAAAASGSSHQPAVEYIRIAATACGIRTLYVQENFGVSGSAVFEHNIERVAIAPCAWTDGKDAASHMTIIDAVARYLGYTATVIGGSLYMFDRYAIKTMTVPYLWTEYSLSTTWARVSDNSTEASSPFAAKTVTASMFTGTDNRLSIAQAYGSVSVDLDTKNALNILDSLFTGEEKPVESLQPMEYVHDVSGTGHSEHHVIRLYTLDGVNAQCAAISQTGASVDPLAIRPVDTAFLDGAQPVRMQRRSIYYTGGTRTNIKRSEEDYLHIRFRSKSSLSQSVTVLRLGSGLTDGRRFRLTGKVLYDADGLSVPPQTDIDGMKGKSQMFQFDHTGVSAYLKVGGTRYYIYDHITTGPQVIYGKWSAAAGNVPFTFGSDETYGEKEINDSGPAYDTIDTGWIDSTIDGEMEFSVVVTVNGSTYDHDLWLKDWKIEVIGDEPEEADLKATLDAANDDSVSVRTGLLTVCGNYRRVAKISSFQGNYLAQTQAATQTAPVTGVLLSQASGIYASARKVVTLQLDETVTPTNAVRYDGRLYGVDSMSWNLSEETKKITIR